MLINSHFKCLQKMQAQSKENFYLETNNTHYNIDCVYMMDIDSHFKATYDAEIVSVSFRGVNVMDSLPAQLLQLIQDRAKAKAAQYMDYDFGIDIIERKYELICSLYDEQDENLCHYIPVDTDIINDLLMDDGCYYEDGEIMGTYEQDYWGVNGHETRPITTNCTPTQGTHPAIIQASRYSLLNFIRNAK